MRPLGVALSLELQLGKTDSTGLTIHLVSFTANEYQIIKHRFKKKKQKTNIVDKTTPQLRAGE